MERKIIDVSYHNGTIDWQAVKASGIEGAILRCGFGDDIASQDDKQWKRNADECTRLGIPFGVYIYSYAKTEAQSRSEAAHVLRLIKGYKLSYPVYLDLEESGTESHAVAGAKIFCDIVGKAGYWVGIYANQHWFNNVIGNSLDRYTKWVARYSTQKPNVACDMWQYRSDGTVSGINGRVDMNICYRDFLTEIGSPAKPSTPNPSTPSGSTLDLAVATLQGEYGNGDARKTALGTRYNEVQNFINHISSASANTLAEEVKSGKYGNGDTRKIVLGNRYTEVQNIVNGGSYYKAFNSGSIVDGLKSIGVDVSFNSRKRIAAANGIGNYSGTAQQNNTLCSLAKQGKLKKA